MSCPAADAAEALHPTAIAVIRAGDAEIRLSTAVPGRATGAGARIIDACEWFADLAAIAAVRIELARLPELVALSAAAVDAEIASAALTCRAALTVPGPAAAGTREQAHANGLFVFEAGFDQRATTANLGASACTGIAGLRELAAILRAFWL